MNLAQLSEMLAAGELSSDLVEKLAHIDRTQLRTVLGKNLREDELDALLARIEALVSAHKGIQ